MGAELRSPRSVLGASAGKGLPQTERGRRTRASLLAAARVVFEQDGFLEARIADIAAGAGVAHGTFYNYFESKIAVFIALVNAIQGDLIGIRDQNDGRLPGRGSPAEQIRDSNQVYLRSYRRNARFIAVLEQVVTIDDSVRVARREVRRAFVQRVERALVRWAAAGVADSDIDTRYAANALCNMVDRFAYTWFVLGEDYEEGRAVETLTRLWCQAVGVAYEPLRHDAKSSARAANDLMFHAKHAR